jgi:hypothetical protein
MLCGARPRIAEKRREDAVLGALGNLAGLLGRIPATRPRTSDDVRRSRA